MHSTVDMKTILDMQIAILGAKKLKLPAILPEANVTEGSKKIIAMEE